MMRTRTRNQLANLAARKRHALMVLLVMVCGGIIVGSGALA